MKTAIDTERKSRAIGWAKFAYESDTISFDSNPPIAPTNKGIWVQAWVWCPNTAIRQPRRSR